MTAAVRSEQNGIADEPAATSAERSLEDVRAMTGAVGAVLRESVAKFEETVDRITEIVALRSGAPERDLVVTLQAFDRLQQEFTALGNMLGRIFVKAESATGDGEYRVPVVDEVVAAISLSDLRQRIRRELGGCLSEAEAEEEAVF